jgi:ubiquitin related modifier 1
MNANFCHRRNLSRHIQLTMADNEAPQKDTISIKIQFGGGAELLFGNVRSHDVVVPATASATPSGSKQADRPADLTFLIDWMRTNMLKEREELFIEGEGM